MSANCTPHTPVNKSSARIPNRSGLRFEGTNSTSTISPPEKSGWE
jgi:hypothetical protein